MEDLNQIIRNLESSLKLSWEIKKNMKGVWNHNLTEIENSLLREGFNVVKILGAGGGGYILIKYQGENLERDKKKLKNCSFDLIPVNIHAEGCESWVI